MVLSQTPKWFDSLRVCFYLSRNSFLEKDKFTLWFSLDEPNIFSSFFGAVKFNTAGNKMFKVKINILYLEFELFTESGPWF